MTSRAIIKKNRYQDFFESLTPVTIALVHLASKMDRARYLASEQDQIHVNFRSKLLGKDDYHFDVRTTLNIRITSGNKDTKPLARFSATYDLHFHADGATIENVDHFVKSDVRLIIWPYLRELIASTSARMHVPPIILPIGNNPK